MITRPRVEKGPVSEGRAPGAMPSAMEIYANEGRVCVARDGARKGPAAVTAGSFGACVYDKATPTASLWRRGIDAEDARAGAMPDDGGPCHLAPREEFGIRGVQAVVATDRGDLGRNEGGHAASGMVEVP